MSSLVNEKREGQWALLELDIRLISIILYSFHKNSIQTQHFQISLYYSWNFLYSPIMHWKKDLKVITTVKKERYNLLKICIAISMAWISTTNGFFISLARFSIPPSPQMNGKRNEQLATNEKLSSVQRLSLLYAFLYFIFLLWVFTSTWHAAFEFTFK